MGKTVQQLIKNAFEAAKTMPPANSELIKELATMLDVSNITLRQACKERDAMKEEVISGRKNAIELLSVTQKPAAICTCWKQCAI